MSRIMISLDKNILAKDSRAALRLASLDSLEKTFVLIPCAEARETELKKGLAVVGTGGGKLQQFLRLIRLGKKIIKDNDVREITSQDPFFTGLAGLILKRHGKIILEVQLHGDFFSGDYYKESGYGNLLRYIMARFIVLPQADKIRAVGQRIKQSLLKMGFPEKKIEARPVYLDKDFIANFVPKVDLRAKYSDFKKIFLFLGRLEKVKNIPWLIDVFSELRPRENGYLLLLVGSGSEKEKIEKRIAYLDLANNIRLEDWTNDPLSYLKTVDAFVFSSLSEGYGLAPVEAFYAGCPLVMTDVGVANFELLPGEKVKIVPVGDKEKFSQALREI